VEKEIDELNQLILANQPKEEPDFLPEELAEEIDIETFAKTDLRVAKVLECEKVKKSKKLLKLQLDDGMGGRQVVSGVAPWYKPEDLIGKKIMLVANLKPVKLCGVESCGMICAADTADGDVKVIFPDDSLPVGAKIH
jgi:methionyl-tRNA synthetase